MCFGGEIGHVTGSVWGQEVHRSFEQQSTFTEPKTSGVPIVQPPKGPPKPDNRDYSRLVLCSDGEFRPPIAAAAFEKEQNNAE